MFWEKFLKIQLNVEDVAENACRGLEEKLKNYDDYVLFYLLFIECIAGLHNAQYANICIEHRTTSVEVLTYTVLSLWVVMLWFCVDVFVQIFCPE